MKLSKLKQSTAMRNVGGRCVPRQDRMSVHAKKAAKAYACGGAVEGEDAIPRLDRPGRKIKRADGGGIDGGRADISKDSLRYAREQRKIADQKANTRNLHMGLGAASGVASALSGSGKVLRGFNIGAAATQAAQAASAQSERNKALTRADRAERGLVAEGEEDRKHGGRIAKKDGGWIEGATKNKGALHRALKVPMGEKIPEKKLDKAADSDNPTMRKRANLAKTLKGFSK